MLLTFSSRLSLMISNCIHCIINNTPIIGYSSYHRHREYIFKQKYSTLSWNNFMFTKIPTVTLSVVVLGHIRHQSVMIKILCIYKIQGVKIHVPLQDSQWRFHREVSAMSLLNWSSTWQLVPQRDICSLWFKICLN